MSRKYAGDLDEQRTQIAAKYRRGRLTRHEIRADASLTDIERQMKQEMACFLKAQDYSYNYMSQVLGVSARTIQGWFQNSDLMVAVKAIRDDMIDGGYKLLKTYTIELIETLMGVVRTTDDERLAVQVMQDLLDRLGLSKVNKSESVSAATLREQREIDITDKTGIVEAMRNAPAEAQAAVAQAAEDLLALAQEHANA